MFVAIANTPRDYAWGSATAIAELLGTTPTGGPEAELWLGAHPGSPAVIVDPAGVGGARDLAEWIATASGEVLGSHPRLPFLLKILAAGSPLSLQAHPSAEQAAEGFARENALGIPLDAANRNYKDPYPKPELIYALSERFEALCGFRPLAETRALLAGLGLDGLAARLDSLPDAFEWLITRGPGVDELVARVTALAAAGSVGSVGSPASPAALPASAPPKTKEIGPDSARNGTEASGFDPISFVFSERDGVETAGQRNGDTATAAALDTVRMLAAEYPGDPGIVVSLLLNRVTLRRGEVLYLPAGNIHAYLGGLGIELMVASDNVLRGGLTPKHIDVPELLRVLDFTPTPPPYLAPAEETDAATVFRPDGPGFALVHVRGTAHYPLTGPAIAICTAGTMTIDGATSSASLARGESVYVTPDEGSLRFAGAGELFLAATA